MVEFPSLAPMKTVHQGNTFEMACANPDYPDCEGKVIEVKVVLNGIDYVFYHRVFKHSCVQEPHLALRYAKCSAD